MKRKIKQFLCGVFTGHCFKDTDRIVEYNEREHTFTITERCCRCGKIFSFTAEERLFGGGEGCGFKEFAAAVASMTDVFKNMSEIFQRLQERSKQVISTDTRQKCHKQKNTLHKQKIYSAAAIHKQEIRLAAAMYAGIPP